MPQVSGLSGLRVSCSVRCKPAGCCLSVLTVNVMISATSARRGSWKLHRPDTRQCYLGEGGF